MRKTSASLAVLGALVVAAVVAQPAAAGSFHGVVPQGSLGAGDFQRMGEGNVGTLRVIVGFQRSSPYSWGSLDNLIGGAAASGIRVIPAVVSANQGANRVHVIPSVASAKQRGTAKPPTSKKARKAYARFVGAMADRYGRNGAFWSGSDRFAIHSWQIMNEQNGPAYWGARPNPRKYAKLLKAASKSINRADRRAEIVLGGMFSTPSGPGAINSWVYLRKLYQARGVKGAFDTVAVHPYSDSLGGIKAHIGLIRNALKDNGDAGARLRITEFGWGSANHGNLNKGRKGQARMLKQAFRLFERKRRSWNVKGANWFAWEDNPGGACSFCPTAGLFTSGENAKPSWRAFKKIAK
jgi:hypothetical protein